MAPGHCGTQANSEKRGTQHFGQLRMTILTISKIRAESPKDLFHKWLLSTVILENFEATVLSITLGGDMMLPVLLQYKLWRKISIFTFHMILMYSVTSIMVVQNRWWWDFLTVKVALTHSEAFQRGLTPVSCVWRLNIVAVTMERNPCCVFWLWASAGQLWGFSGRDFC